MTARRSPYGARAYRRAKKALAGLPCRYCGAPSDSVDHVKPLSRGGANTLDNMAPSCLPCNVKRGGRLGAAARSKRRGGREYANPRY